MANPNLKLYNAADTSEITAINYGSGDAGEILPTSAGTEYHLWNDKGGTSTSDTALNIKVRVRDADGNEEDPITTQQWIEIQSTTIEAGSTGASVGSYTDDNMPDFQPIGGDNYVTLGGIPSDCYRKIYVRCNIPPGASQTAVTFSLYFDYQDPSIAIANGITDIHGNGINPSTGNLIEVTDSTGADSIVSVNSGIAYINSNEVTVYSQTKTLSTSSGSYNVYVTVDGVVSYVSTTGSIPTNALNLAEVAISSGQVTTVTDKRVFLGNIQAGTSGSASTSPDIGDIYLATTSSRTFKCFSSGSWTVDCFLNLDDTPSDFTGDASKLLRVNSTEDAIEFVSATGLALDGFGTPSTGTDLNATTGHHGLLPTLNGSTSAVFIGNGTWSTSFSSSTGGGSTATTFIELTDTPASYSSAASYLLRVNNSTNAVEFVSATGLALDGFGTPSTGNNLNASTSRHGLLPKLTGSTTDYLLANGTWAAIPGSSGGEANTASNENTTGVGVFWQKDGVNLEFKGVHSTGGVITITDTTGTHTINLDFISTGVKLDDLGTPDDNTNLNASTSAHGLLPKLGGSTTTYLAGDGTWGTPPNTGSTTFVALDDTPASYTTGTAGQLLRVNSSTNAIEFVSSTGIKLDDLGTPDDNTDLNASTSYHGLLPKLTGSTTNYLLADGSWASIPGSSGGEANTGSNENTTGVGVFWQKDGVNLEFKGIHSTGNISVTDATGTHTVNIDVITTGITLNDLDTPYAVTTGNVMSFGAHSAGFTEQSSTATTGTATIDWSNGNKALYTRSTGAGGACTIAFTDPPKSMSVMLIIRGSTAGSSGAISWSTGNTIYWSSTTTPSFSTGASAIDVVGLYYSTGLGGYLAMGTTNFSTI